MGTVCSWGLRFWHWGRQWSCRRFVDFVIGCSLSSWTVDELTKLDFLTSYFSARCYAMRGICSGPVSVSLYVRPSVTLVHCLHEPIPNCKGNPFSGGAKYKRGGKIFSISDGNRSLSRNNKYEIGPRLLCNVNRKSYTLYRMVTFSMTLTNP